MARTSKSRGAAAFKMRSGNNSSPNKFLKGLGKKVMGGVANVLGIGGRGGGGADMAANAEMQGVQSRMPAGGALFGNSGMPMTAMTGMMGKPNLPSGGPMYKKAGYTPYKKVGCASPMKTDAILVRGAYDAASGKGTKKYGDISKARAFTSISKTTGETFGYLVAQRKMKKDAERRASLKHQKRQWKKDAKFEKWKDRKGKGWKDKMRYA
tara:strand:+ start:9094 stop:9723 length:630 start_codon:yes stop_codon:yes gene_type:complete